MIADIVDFIIVLVLVMPVAIAIIVLRGFNRALSQPGVVPGLLRAYRVSKWLLAAVFCMVPLYAIWFYLTDRELWDEEGVLFCFVVVPLLLCLAYGMGVVWFNINLNIVLYRMYKRNDIVNAPEVQADIRKCVKRARYLHAILFRLRGVSVAEVLQKTCLADQL